MAEQYETTPWDVRKNVTYWDIERTSIMNEARSAAQKNKQALDNAKSLLK